MSTHVSILHNHVTVMSNDQDHPLLFITRAKTHVIATVIVIVIIHLPHLQLLLLTHMVMAPNHMIALLILRILTTLIIFLIILTLIVVVIPSLLLRATTSSLLPANDPTSALNRSPSVTSPAQVPKPRVLWWCLKCLWSS